MNLGNNNHLDNDVTQSESNYNSDNYLDEDFWAEPSQTQTELIAEDDENDFKQSSDEIDFKQLSKEISQLLIEKFGLTEENARKIWICSYFEEKLGKKYSFNELYAQYVVSDKQWLDLLEILKDQ